MVEPFVEPLGQRIRPQRAQRLVFLGPDLGLKRVFRDIKVHSGKKTLEVEPQHKVGAAIGNRQVRNCRVDLVGLGGQP